MCVCVCACSVIFHLSLSASRPRVYDRLASTIRMSGYRRVNYYELCRLCTSSEGSKMNIFLEEGRRRQLQTKIQTYLPVQVGIFFSFFLLLCLYMLVIFFFFFGLLFDERLFIFASRATVYAREKIFSLLEFGLTLRVFFFSFVVYQTASFTQSFYPFGYLFCLFWLLFTTCCLLQNEFWSVRFIFWLISTVFDFLHNDKL